MLNESEAVGDAGHGGEEPMRADPAEKEAERLENEGEPLGGLAGCGGHDHGSLTACVPPCPGFRSPTSQASPLLLSPQGADPEPQAPTAADLTARVVARMPAGTPVMISDDE